MTDIKIVTVFSSKIKSKKILTHISWIYNIVFFRISEWDGEILQQPAHHDYAHHSYFYLVLNLVVLVASFAWIART